MPAVKRGLVRVEVLVPPDLAAAIDRRADKYGSTKTRVLLNALEIYFALELAEVRAGKSGV
jgi:predicted transcriptional regulator